MSTHQAVVGERWKVVRTLARADGPRLTLSLWFCAGLGLALLGSGVFVNLALTDSTVGQEDLWTVHAGFVLLTVFAMIAANFAALRDHRGHTFEQHRALPVGGPARVTGLTLAMVWPAVTSTLLLGSVLAFAAARLEVPGSTVVYLLHNAVLVVTMGALGVTLGAWVHSAFAAPVLAFVLYLVHPGETPAAWHALWPFASLESAALESWHLAYLLGLTLVLVAVAQSRWVRHRHQVAALLAGCALVVTSVLVMVTQVCPQPGLCSL